MLCRACCEKTISLAAMTSISSDVCWLKTERAYRVEGPPASPARAQLFDHGKDVVLAEDQVLGAVDLDVAARVLGEEDLVAGLDLELAQRAVLLDLAVAHGDDQRLERLLLGAVGDVKTPGGLALLFQTL